MYDIPIKDKAGKPYTLAFFSEDDDDFFHLMLLDGEQMIGEVKCLFRPPDTMELSDICIRDEVVPKGCLIPYGLRRKWWARNYQGRGLGTALLRFTLDYARQRGVQQVVGSVYHRDLSHNPHLLDWYHGFGFEAVPEKANTMIAAQIHLELG